MATQTEPKPRTASGVFPITETFMNDRTDNPNWKIHPNAQLNGSLQLTSDDYNQAGAALLDQAFPSSEGVAIDFDYSVEHSGGNSAGDGFSFFLIDGSVTTEPGGYGAGLGYAFVNHDRGSRAGVTKGYVGVGFDTYGNFGGGLTGPGGPGNTANMLCVRGSGDGWNGFNWLTGAAVSGGFSATWDDKAHVQIFIVDGKLTVRLSTKDDPNGTAVVDGFPIQGDGQAPLPETLKLGLAASTGDATQAHRVRRLKVALPTSVPLEMTGPEQAQAGSKVCYKITVHNEGPHDNHDAVVEGQIPAELHHPTLSVKTSGGAHAERGSVTNGVLKQPLDLPVGASAVITVCGTLDRHAQGQITATSQITSPMYTNISDKQHGRVTTRIPDVVIKDVNYQGSGRAQADEYVEITNQGTAAADLSGWTLGADDAGQDFTFPPGTMLQPGQTVRVHTNENHPESGGFSYGSNRAIWNNQGDVARLNDPSGHEWTNFPYGDKRR
ncbi:lamin tail domain-containing protein [Streptomyces sp. SudanB182_2057]|uniref:lamin tail domain-containing protein n=1 Tax=Streptomyces sp. SudanB182_2057 TaxID=3035281 RepID=UPI003F56F889